MPTTKGEKGEEVQRQVRNEEEEGEEEGEQRGQKEELVTESKKTITTESLQT